MELKWLEDFLAVAASGNFSRAAEARHVTQPAFSRRLKALELWLGLPLLDRSSYPITLTPAGIAFLPLAERVVRELLAGRDEARSLAAASERTIRFAMPHSLAAGVFPRWWQGIASAHPGLTVRIIAENFHDCVELLLHGGCDFLMCYRHAAVPDPLTGGGRECIAIGEDRLLPVCAADVAGHPMHPLARGGGTPARFLNYAPDAFLGKVTARLLDGVVPRLSLDLRYESAFAEALRAQTLAGGGVAWLPSSLIANDLANGRLVAAGPGLPEAALEIELHRALPASSRRAEELWQAARGSLAIPHAGAT